MSDLQKLWLKSYLDLLRKKAMQGASNAVIATELMFLQKQGTASNSYTPTEQDVAQKREELKLPPENPALAALASVLPFSKPVVAPVVQAEEIVMPEVAAKREVIKIAPSRGIAPIDYKEKASAFKEHVDRLNRPEKPEKVSEPKPVFNEVAGEKPQEAVVKLPPELSLEFEPAHPVSYKKGTKYYHPIHGVVQYEGMTKTQTSVGTFEMMKFTAGKEILQIAPSKVAAHNIRMFVDVKFMDIILQGIGDKTIRGKRPAGKGLSHVKSCTEVLSSGDPVKLAGLIYWAFKVPELKKINSVYGDKAIARLAEEYALIKGMDLGKATKMFIERSGRPTGAELLKNTESPQYMRRNSAGPSL